MKPGMKVLDVACGPGYVSNSISLRGGESIGIDFSANMISWAKQFFPNLIFLEGDAQQLSFPDESFDRVVMNFGILHLSNPQKAISEAYRVLRRGGKYGFTAWGGINDSPAANAFEAVIDKHADQTVPMPDAPAYDMFADQSLCCDFLRMAEFDVSHFRFDPLLIRWLVPDAHFYFDAQLNAGVRRAAFLKQQSAEVLEKIRRDLVTELDQFRTANGLALPFCGFIIVADKK
jgi:SAM-dependent methyltransferase